MICSQLGVVREYEIRDRDEEDLEIPQHVHNILKALFGDGESVGEDHQQEKFGKDILEQILQAGIQWGNVGQVGAYSKAIVISNK